MEIKPTRISDREVEICELFKTGTPITEISKILGGNVSYQAVHRILKKNNLSRKDGGKFVQTSTRREEQAKEKTQKLDNRYGCTDEQWAFLRGQAEAYKDTPLSAYNTFKNNFKNLYKDIPFELTLWDWWTLWDESKKWGQHKRNPAGMFVMSFIDPKQPFMKTNARVIAFSGLLKEQRAPKPKVVIESEPEQEEALA